MIPATPKVESWIKCLLRAWVGTRSICWKIGAPTVRFRFKIRLFLDILKIIQKSK